MQIKVRIEIFKILNFDFELSSSKKKEDTSNEKKELPAPVSAAGK